MVHVVVVGGGVNGVGSALALLQKAPKCHVTIVSDEFSPYTTGDGAGGLWGPYLLQGTPEEKILSWGQETWNLFRDWWKSEKNYGVSLVSGTVICQENEPTQPWYQIPLAYTTLTQDQLVKYGPEYKSGYRYTSFIAEASRFLPKLMVEVQERGGKFENQHVKSLHEVASQADLVLNCSGLGAKAVVPDDGVYPTRGQVMRVREYEAYFECWVIYFDSTTSVYIITFCYMLK
ncbi:hypothetical protein SK128_001262 [Halocaridina rubra]|uniref:FAD dependent oxidoreductase domain-containing protein n=1 Tax=Halocaridina rubra TaxID=373956 RepID=A0AAN8ZX17_HALRR